MSAPDRWEAYSKIGKLVEGTLFIPFKVPLKHSVLESLPKGVDNKWNVEDLIEAIPSPGLGLVIDLTFTRRYYDPQQFTSKEISHKKIMTKGHVIPNSTVVEQFCTAVDEHLAKEDGKLIGVHCTHGLNRTGYLICRYMIQKLGIDPKVAIAAFDEARGHKQERINYTQDLKTKGWEDSKDELKSAKKKVNANTNSEDEVESKKAVNEVGNKKRKLNEDNNDVQTPKKVKVDQKVSSNVNGNGKKKKKKRKKKKKIGNANINLEDAVEIKEAVNEIGNKKRKLNEDDDDVQIPKKVKVDQIVSSNVNGEGKKKKKKKGNGNTNSEYLFHQMVSSNVNAEGKKKKNKSNGGNKKKSKKNGIDAESFSMDRLKAHVKFRKMEKEKKKLSATK